MKIGLRIPCYRRWCRAAEVRAIAEAAERLGFRLAVGAGSSGALLGSPEEVAVGGTSAFLGGCSRW
jgi:hypothetical protein